MGLFDFKNNWRKPVAGIAVAGAVLAGFTMNWEGVVLETYKDPVGIKTIGVGHTGADVKDGMKITRKQAEEILIKDLQKHWDGIKGYIKVPLYEHEAMAYTDFAFNVGVGAFKKSTLLKKLNQGRYPEACAELKKWVYAGGKQLKGLVKRREAEYKLCMTEPPKEEKKDGQN